MATKYNTKAIKNSQRERDREEKYATSYKKCMFLPTKNNWNINVCMYIDNIYFIQ